MSPRLLRWSRLGLILSLLGVHASCQNGCDTVEPTPTPSSEPTPEPEYDRGAWLDMDLDDQGRVWIAYQDLDATALFIGRGTGDPVTFQHWGVDGVGVVSGGLLTGNFDSGAHATIAVDSAGRAHAAHFDLEDKRLRYAAGDGEAWDTETVDDSGTDTGRWSSIGLVNDAPIIAYYDKASGDLKAAQLSGGDWQTEVVDSGAGTTIGGGDDDDSAGEEQVVNADVGAYADLHVADNGLVWIAYYDATRGALKVARGSFGNWTILTLDDDGDVGQWPSLASAGGTLHVAYHDVGSQNLLYGTWDGSNFERETVDASPFVGADSAIALVGGDPVIAYQDSRNNDAKLARRSGGAWTTEVHAADGALGFHNSLLVGTDGRLNWSCYDHTRTEIVFQRFQP